MRIRTHTNPFNCRQRFEKQDWSELFPGFCGKLDFEVGFGRGLFLRNYAKQNFDRFIVGIDVRLATVKLLESKLQNEDIENVLTVHGNGLICLEDMFADEELDNIFVFHPDPWVKKQHRKRRVINLEFVELAAKKLKKGGKFYVSTDVEELWNEILDVFKSCDSFDGPSTNDKFWEESYKTRWNEMSLQEQRHDFFGAFTLK